VDEVIATWNLQVAEAFIEPPDSDRLLAPAEGEKVALVQVVDALGVAATTTPAGNVMLSLTPDIDDAFGLVSVTVMVEASPATIEVGLSVVTDVGAAVLGSPLNVMVMVASVGSVVEVFKKKFSTAWSDTI
jgi:hypothetical protein